MTAPKLNIRVIDIPSAATAAECEALLNVPYADGYYSDKTIVSGLPEGVGLRAFFRLRASER